MKQIIKLMRIRYFTLRQTTTQTYNHYISHKLKPYTKSFGKIPRRNCKKEKWEFKNN
jgi:hypothetical protein